MPRNEYLLQKRIQHNWRQKDVAKRLGVSLLTVQRWELSTQQPSPYYRAKLCDLFGLNAQELGLEHMVPPSHLPESSSSATAHSDRVSHEGCTLWTVPYLRNPYFTGRDDLFRLLDEHLVATQQGRGPTTRRVALTGLGGIGKTQLAVEYAYRKREQGRHTIWINAASKEAIITDFTNLAETLSAYPAREGIDSQKLADAIRQWLEECTSPWLLIFDNADDLSLLPAYFPRYGNGSILLTTRTQAVGSLATAIDVEKMDLLEGTDLIVRRAQRLAQASDDEVSIVRQLVVALDYLPLALEQAGAYIEETGCTFDHYLHLYHNHRSILLARRSTHSTHYPYSVATTWSLAFENIQQTCPAAAQLLQLCAFLAPDHIPEELIRNGAVYWPLLLQQAVTDPLAFDQVFEVLLRFSLIKRLSEDHLLSIHRLVQVIQIEMIASEEQCVWAERVVRVVNSLFPRQPREEISSWGQCLRYLEQAQACNLLIQRYQVQLSEAADLLGRAGTFLSFHASYALAEVLYQQAQDMREKLLGPQHPETLSGLYSLGRLYYEQGKYEQSESYSRRSLLLSEQVLGPQHLQTAEALNNLGLICWQQGRYEQAECYLQRTLTIREAQCGTQHLYTAGSLNNLGVLSYTQGRYEQAACYLQRALAIHEAQCGMQHPSIAKALTNLGCVYYEQGRYEQVEFYSQQMSAMREDVLELQHSTINNPNCVSWRQGRYEQAACYLQRALTIREKLLGLHHPETANSLHHLGYLYYEQGKYEQAEAYAQQALAIREEVLGPQHLDTAKTLTNLAELYRDQRKYEQAALLFTRALVIQEHMLATKHPDFARTLHGFARFYEKLSILQTASDFYQQALTIREKVYGPQHAKTSETRKRLQTVLSSLVKGG